MYCVVAGAALAVLASATETLAQESVDAGVANGAPDVDGGSARPSEKALSPWIVELFEDEAVVESDRRAAKLQARARACDRALGNGPRRNDSHRCWLVFRRYRKARPLTPQMRAEVERRIKRLQDFKQAESRRELRALQRASQCADLNFSRCASRLEIEMQREFLAGAKREGDVP